ncbi:MAG: protoporphyrinogen oxidase [Phototrophicaceae bacterium]
MPVYDSHVAVIGGGISGLSAAWELQRANIPYALIEKSERWGGKIITESLDGALVEGGPEALVTRKPEVYDLAMELGLHDQIKPASGEARGIYILTNGVPLAVPLGPLAFLTSPLMSWRGKLRLFKEPFVTPRTDDGDESLADFTRRRLGDEALEKLVGPILGGIYNTDPNTQSILTTSPVMRELETTYGGLFKGLLGRMRAARRDRRSGAAPRPRFISFAARRVRTEKMYAD